MAAAAAAEEKDSGDGDSELRRLIVPDLDDLPAVAPSAVEANFVTYFAVGESSKP